MSRRQGDYAARGWFYGYFLSGMGAGLCLRHDLYRDLPVFLFHFYRLESVRHRQRNIRQLMRFDQRSRDVYVGNIVYGKRQVKGGGALVHIDILVRHHFIRLQGDQHTSAERRFEQGLHRLAGVEGGSVQLDIYMPFVVDVKGGIVPTPGTLAIEAPAHITVGAGYGDEQFALAGG